MGMATLTLKMVEDDVLERLAQKAAADGRSVQEYVRRLLERDARMSTSAELLARQRAARTADLTSEERERIERLMSGRRPG